MGATPRFQASRSVSGGHPIPLNSTAVTCPSTILLPCLWFWAGLAEGSVRGEERLSEAEGCAAASPGTISQTWVISHHPEGQWALLRVWEGKSSLAAFALPRRALASSPSAHCFFLFALLRNPALPSGFRVCPPHPRQLPPCRLRTPHSGPSSR